ncbi:MAG: hypothetical protein ACLT8H_01385 [Streptococcus parasanguinis]
MYPELQERTVCYHIGGIETGTKHQSLWPTVIRKAKALLSVLKANYINHLVTDEATIYKSA